MEDHDLDEGLHPAERHVATTTFDYYDLQHDDEPFHGNVTEDDREPPAQLDATPVALEQQKTTTTSVYQRASSPRATPVAATCVSQQQSSGGNPITVCPTTA